MAIAARLERGVLVPQRGEFNFPPQIDLIGNGKDLHNPFPTARSEAEKNADDRFRDIATRPIFPPSLYVGPRAIDKFFKSKLGSIVRPDALRFEVSGRELLLRELFEFGITDVELFRKWTGMEDFVDEIKKKAYLEELFETLRISGKPSVGEIRSISLTFVRKYAPIDRVYEDTPFARVSVRTPDAI